jgi:hypothetical protein
MLNETRSRVFHDKANMGVSFWYWTVYTWPSMNLF